MKNRNFKLIGTLGLGLSLSFSNVLAKDLTLKEALDLTKKNHAKLQEAKINIDAATYSLDEAKGSYKPAVNLDSKYMHHPEGVVSKVGGNKIKQNYSTETTITLSQAVYTFGKITNGVNAAKGGLEISKLQLGKTDLEIRNEVKRSYYGTLLTRKVKDIYQESVQNAKKNKSIFEYRFKSGRPPQSDLLQLERDISSRTPSLVSSTMQYENSKSNLASLIGIKEITKLTNDYDENVKIDDYSKLEKTLLGKSYDLQMSKKNIEIQESLYKVEKGKLLPTVGAFASMAYVGEHNDSDFGDNGINNVGTVGLSLTMPIWDSSKRASAGQAFAKKEISRKQHVEAERLLKLKLKTLNTEFYSLKEEIKNNKRFLELAKNTYNMSKKRFRNGQTSIIEINDTEQLLTQAKLQIANNIYKLNIVKLNIEELINGENHE